MLEGLALYWDFYFMAEPDPRGVGVTDLVYAVGLIGGHSE